jgi:hypothetical protein
MFVILLISRDIDTAQAQKTQDQIWQEQHEGQTYKCLLQNTFREYEEGTGQSTAETEATTETCNHDMLYMLGICEQNNDEYTFCENVHTYIDDHNLEQISERPEQLSQETIDGINEHDWNEDGVTDGSDFVTTHNLRHLMLPNRLIPSPNSQTPRGKHLEFLLTLLPKMATTMIRMRTRITYLDDLDRP